MGNKKNELKSGIDNLCKDYIKALEGLYEKGLINKETFENCTSKKVIFIKE